MQQPAPPTPLPGSSSCFQDRYSESTPECPIGSVSYFRVSSQEKNLHPGDLQADRQASTATSSDVDSPCSPVSADSKPSSLSFNISDVSDICIRQLFDQSVVSQNINLAVDYDHDYDNSTVPRLSPLAARQFCSYFRKFWTCNILGGLSSKIDEISEVILMNEIDIAVLAETWLHPGISNNLLVVAGYSIFRKDRSDGRGGWES